MTNMGVRAYVAFRRFLQSERGSGIIDYVAVGLVILGLAGALAAGLSKNGDSLAQAVVDALKRLFDKIQ